MKLKRCVALFFVAALLMLEGCSSYDYYESDKNLNMAKVYLAYWPDADSALFEFAADTSHSGLFVYGNYSPQADGLERNVSKDSTIYKFNVWSNVGPEEDVFSIQLVLRYETPNEHYYSGSVSDTFFVDVYGCTDFACKKAEKVVAHNEDYSFTRLLSKDEFEISRPSHDFKTYEEGYDCDVVKEYYFHLKIDVDDVKIDLDAQKGSETCYQRSSKWCRSG